MHAVSAETCEVFLGLYKQAFAPLKAKSPARQWLTDDEFRHEMNDESFVKFVARDKTDAVVAIATMATDLETVPWISVPFFQEKYPEHFARGAVFYFGSMLVRPERQGGPWAAFLLNDVIKYMVERRAVAAYDCCGFNVDIMQLPDLLKRAARRSTQHTVVELDQQRYYAFEFQAWK